MLPNHVLDEEFEAVSVHEFPGVRGPDACADELPGAGLTDFKIGRRPNLVYGLDRDDGSRPAGIRFPLVEVENDNLVVVEEAFVDVGQLVRAKEGSSLERESAGQGVVGPGAQTEP